MEAVVIYFSKIKTDAVIPSKRLEDAGYDVYACFDEDYIKVEPHQTVVIPTGIASACPPDYFFRIAERGSTGVIGISQRSGIIDSGYRGEWFIPLTNLNSIPLYFVKPEKKQMLKEAVGEGTAVIYSTDKAICQALLLPVPRTEIRDIPYSELNGISSERGSGCLGQSNK